MAQRRGSSCLRAAKDHAAAEVRPRAYTGDHNYAAPSPAAWTSRYPCPEKPRCRPCSMRPRPRFPHSSQRSAASLNPAYVRSALAGGPEIALRTSHNPPDSQEGAVVIQAPKGVWTCAIFTTVVSAVVHRAAIDAFSVEFYGLHKQVLPGAIYRRNPASGFDLSPVAEMSPGRAIDHPALRIDGWRRLRNIADLPQLSRPVRT